MNRQYMDPEPLKNAIAKLEAENASLKAQVSVAGPASTVIATLKEPSIIFVDARSVEPQRLMEIEAEVRVSIVPVVVPEGSTLAECVKQEMAQALIDAEDRYNTLKQEFDKTTEGVDARLQAAVDAGRPLSEVIPATGAAPRLDWPAHSTSGPGAQVPAEPPPSDPFGGIDKFADEHRAHDRQLTGEQGNQQQQQ